MYSNELYGNQEYGDASGTTPTLSPNQPLASYQTMLLLDVYFTSAKKYSGDDVYITE